MVRLSALLAEIVGTKPLSREYVVKRLWTYVKANKLQGPLERRMINADVLLLPLFEGKARVSMFDISKYLNKHLTKA